MDATSGGPKSFISKGQIQTDSQTMEVISEFLCGLWGWTQNFYVGSGSGPQFDRGMYLGPPMDATGVKIN